MLQDERREDRDGSRGGEALPKGTRLGDYEIGAELGAGGCFICCVDIHQCR